MNRHDLCFLELAHSDGLRQINSANSIAKIDGNLAKYEITYAEGDFLQANFNLSTHHFPNIGFLGRNVR